MWISRKKYEELEEKLCDLEIKSMINDVESHPLSLWSINVFQESIKEFETKLKASEATNSILTSALNEHKAEIRKLKELNQPINLSGYWRKKFEDLEIELNELKAKLELKKESETGINAELADLIFQISTLPKSDFDKIVKNVKTAKETIKPYYFKSHQIFKGVCAELCHFKGYQVGIGSIGCKECSNCMEITEKFVKCVLRPEGSKQENKTEPESKEENKSIFDIKHWTDEFLYEQDKKELKELGTKIFKSLLFNEKEAKPKEKQPEPKEVDVKPYYFERRNGILSEKCSFVKKGNYDIKIGSTSCSECYKCLEYHKNFIRCKLMPKGKDKPKTK